ncbi:MAG: right-handed parallel beta-helix repeat-containing protein [Acidobacteriota bacterium]
MTHRARLVAATFARPSRLALTVVFLAGVVAAGWPPQARAQQTLVPGRNVNMVSGTQWPTGDPHLQRQNEPSIAASTRNPLHLLAGANDYRTVDIPFVDGAEETGDAWLGLFKSFDGGQRWQSTLLPGYPQDTSAEGMASPLHGYQAGADPVVRAGTNGLFYYAGLIFERGESGRNAIFVARFIDDNNREAKFREAGYESRNDPIRYLGASLVARSTGRVFYDKPWMAVDIPRGGAKACSIPAAGPSGSVQSVLAGNAYVAFSSITEDQQGLKSEILLSRSSDCGRTWTVPTRISRPADRINQGSTIAIDPRNGTVYAAWRRFSVSAADAGDGFVVVQSSDGGRKFSNPGLARALASGKGKKKGLDPDRYFEHRRFRGATDASSEVAEFDQATSGIDGLLAFRTNMYATMTVDGTGRVYLAWAERGFGQIRPDSVYGDARIVMVTSTDGRSWSQPVAVANENQAGHQIMPSLSFGGGKLVLVYYDLRDDISLSFGPWIDDASAIAANARKRRTLDLRASFGTPGTVPAFEPSIRVSDYLFAWDVSGRPRQLQFNPPNLPMFKQGTAPFMGDYVDVAVAPAFIPTPGGGWTYNLDGPKPVFHAVWTDNRDVIQPASDPDHDGNPWNNYTAPTALTYRTTSRFDPTAPLPNCDPLNTGSRNQNIYTARLTTGLVVGSPGNSKPLRSDFQRAFVVFAQNTTDETKAFRLTVANQPPGGRASFDQFDATVTSVDVTTPYRSTAARTVYVTSSDPDAQVRIDVVEIDAAGQTPAAGGLSDTIILNPDIANPDIANPDIANPDIANPDIANAEVYNPDIANPDIANPDIANPDIANPDIANPDIANPDIANPDIANPDIANPDIANPDIANPDIANVQVANPDIANPDIANPDIANPDIANPDIANPDIANPDIANPDIANATLTDVTWTMTNNGNTTAAFNVNLFLAQQTNKLCGADQTTGCTIATQLILRKVYTTPATVLTPAGTTSCELGVQSQNVLVANVANPRFVLPGDQLTPQNDPSAENATLWLAPGETAKITLRIRDADGDNVGVPDQDGTTPSNSSIDRIFLPTTETSLGSVTPVVQQQSVDTEDVAAVPPGEAPPQPPVVTPLTESVPPAQTPTPLALSYVTQPSGVQAGSPMTPAVQVQVLDQYGALLPNWNVTLYLATNPANASLIGAIATTDALGIATFPAIVIDSEGTGFTLAATSGTALPAVSDPFDVTSPCDPLVVTTIADSPLLPTCGMLRKAIDSATAGHTITFDIAEPAPHVIAPSVPLPPVGGGVIIDATTDPHYALGAGQPVVQISGANMPPDSVGLNLAGAGSALRGLEFNGFIAGPLYTAAAVVLGGGGGHTVQTSHFGKSAGNYTGIMVESSSNVIGGTLPGEGNTIGGATQDQGIWLASGSANRIEGNLIGNNGAAALGNASGILIDAATGTTIGGAITGARNVISGNSVGVLLRGGTGTDIRGNFIGLSAAGTGAIPNTQGVSAYNLVVNTIIQGNFISGNTGWGVNLENTGAGAPTNTLILGNTIGLDTSDAALGNGAGGVRTVNAPGTVVGAPGAGNVIAGNAGGTGVHVGGSVVLAAAPKIQANRIGTNTAGTAVRGNLDGIRVDDTDGAVIGGVNAGEGNLISGNRGNGIILGGAPAGTVIQGNFIGTDASGGAVGLGNGYGPTSCCYSGISLTGAASGTMVGGATPGAGNVIADNQTGIWTGSGSAAIRGNTIEHNHAGGGAIWVQDSAALDIAGNTIRSNAGIGIGLLGSTARVLIGGPAIGDANVITSNGSAGVNVGFSSSGVTVQGNQISANGGLGVDLNHSVLPASPFWPDGVNANDAGDGDAGGNGSQNYPVLSNATSDPGPTTRVDFAFNSQPGQTYALEFFSSPSCDPSGSGEGQQSLGSTAVVTNGSGDVSGTAVLSALALVGEYITATATDANGNTSEFSACTRVVALATGVPATAGGAINVNFGGGAAAAGGGEPIDIAVVAIGGKVTISASGSISTGIGFPNGPSGSGTGTDPSFLSPALPAMSLVARIGTGPWQAVGAGPTELTAATAGIVQLAINDSFFGDNSGAFQVSVALGGIISTTLPAGGTGGGLFGPIDCPAGSVITALKGSYSTSWAPVGAAVVTEVWCSPISGGVVSGPASLAGTTGAPIAGVDTNYGSALTCPAGKVMTAMSGAALPFAGSSVVGYLGVICSTPNGTGPVTLGPVYGPGFSFTLSCSPGQAAAGIQGRQGSFLDQVALRCK